MKEDETNIQFPPGVQGPIEGFPEIPAQEGSGQITGNSKPWAGRRRTAKFQDETDYSVAQQRDLEQGDKERLSQVLSPEEQAEADEARVLAAAIKEAGSVEAYLELNPEDRELAKRFGYPV